MTQEHKCEKCTFLPEILREQLELLSEKSKTEGISIAELVALSEAMDKLMSRVITLYNLSFFRPARDKSSKSQ